MRHLLSLSLMLVTVLLSHLAALADDRGNQERELKGRIFNAVTGAYIPDSVKVDVLTPDSVVVATGYNRLYHELEYKDGQERQYIFDIPVKAAGESFIVRLSHPEYATACYPVKLEGYINDAGRLKMRRLTRFEKATMLGEVVVKASVLQVVNKGDTLQFNADAFAVAKGSMLDALIEQMPGVELRDGGRIYVNGRFVDKLLLDGKDFFQGDQFVLLQNLPAYTVKNVKVYEQASASKEVFGRDDPNDPNKYVMDVTLRKGYNTGWMANAEIGAGSHSRYRGRAFGMGYTSRWRLGAFGYMNNLNETRNPGRDGDWNPADNKSGLTTAKAGGVSYGYFAPDRTMEFTGSTSAQYSKSDAKTLTNTQNFLSEGDTYTRRWNDNLDRNISVSTDNTVTLRPKEGNRYNQMFMLVAGYRKGKALGNTTEGTFGRNITAGADLRERLDNGWVDGMDAINRYIAASEARLRKFEATLMSFTTLSLPHDNGLKLIASGTYRRYDNDGPNFNNYLLQYADGLQVTNERSNPQKSHGYDYNVAVEWFRPLNSYFSIRPRVDFYSTYEYNSNHWLTDADTTDTSLNMLPSMRADAMMHLDPRNSYVTGRHYTNLRPWLPISFDKTNTRDGVPDTRIFAYIDLQANIRRDFIDFDGITRVRAGKNYVSPSVRIGSTFDFHNLSHTIRFSYGLQGSSIDAFDLIGNVVFDSDPLNRRTGNPDLSQTVVHDVNLFYSNSNWMLDRLKMYVDLRYTVVHNQTAMSYAYDRSTGVRTYRPVNVDGNRYGSFVVGPTVALTRDKKLQLVDYLKFEPQRSVDMMSYDDFATTQKSIVNSLYISEYLSLQYNAKKFMAAFDGQIETRRTTSADGFFDPFRVTQLRYGVRGRVTLPAGFEISTDLKMYLTRGFDYHEMNTNQLVWNGRITKTLLAGQLMLSLDGYDMLGNVKNISYKVNEQGRTETWVNNIPSYVMLSLRWNFTKKPRE